MKELKKLFTVYLDTLEVCSKVTYKSETILFGKNFNGNFLEFNFLYKGDNCRVALFGDAKKTEALIETLKVSFNYADSLIIKDKQDFLLKAVLGFACDKKEKDKYEIDYTSCVAISVYSKGVSKELASFLPIYSSCLAVEISQDICVLIKGTNSDKEDYLSLSKFAKILSRAIEEELGKPSVIGVGNPVDNFEDINVSYEQSLQALEFAKKNNRIVYSFLEVLPQKMLASLSIKERNNFLKPFNLLLKNKELMDTAKEFLNNDLNVNLASLKLFIHRNTLIYRLNKIEKLVGLDLRNFNDAVTFRLICLLDETKGDINE